MLMFSIDYSLFQKLCVHAEALEMSFIALVAKNMKKTALFSSSSDVILPHALCFVLFYYI